MTFEQAEAIARIDNRLMLWPERARWLWESVQSVVHLDGEFWETGVYRGGSARLIQELIKSSGKSHVFRLFDTFDGFAYVGPQDADAKDGQLKCYSSVEDGVRDVQSFVEGAIIYSGKVPDTFLGLEDCRIAYAYLDTDLYYPIRETLKFVLPRMVSGGVIVIDDCGDPAAPGVEQAVQEVTGNLIVTKRSCINPFVPEKSANVGWRAEIRIP